MQRKKIEKIVFYGTPEFAVPSLEILSQKYDVVAVVTTPDKPSGRGLKIAESPVKKRALQMGLKVYQPEVLKEAAFVDIIKKANPDVQIVVAFRKLPPEVFSLGTYGTINLHASLLPNYRGAAPINHAIINGETQTGLTTFFINEHIDKGHIILQEPVEITPELNAGNLHDLMMVKGSSLLLKTLETIPSPNFTPMHQDLLTEKNAVWEKAPKILKEDCCINWHQNALQVHNFIRGLSPYPGAYTTLIAPNQKTYRVKIFESNYVEENTSFNHGKVLTDGKSFLRVVADNGLVNLLNLQLIGRKRMPVSDFLRGFPIDSNWTTKPA